MSISLTRDELYERLKDPIRMKLLLIAINEDAKNIFSPLRYQVETKGEISLDIREPLRELAFKWLFRAIDLAYEEDLDL